MKKRMMLFAAGTVIFVSTAQNTFAEEETGGIRKIADMVTEARQIKEKTEMFSASMTLGDMEVSVRNDDPYDTRQCICGHAVF